MGSISCVQTMVWLPVMGILNVRTDVDACDCAQGCTDTIRVSALEMDSGREKNLLQQGLEPASVLHLAIQSDALPTELHENLFS